MIKNKFEDLEVWKESHKLVIMVYKLTKLFPQEEKFRLVDQICRSASSVPANIVEGNSRGHPKEYMHFLYTSKGSLEETKYHILLSRDLDYINNEVYNQLLTQCNLVGSLLAGLIKYLSNLNPKS